MADLAAEPEGEAGPQLSVGKLTADMARLGEELNILEGTKCWAHVDVMDGAFCPQLTVGAPLVAAVASTGLPVDAHLMVHEPIKIVPEIVAAGVSITAPARLRWLARHRPDILRQTGSLGMLSDWIIYRLADVHVTEPSCGTSSGMFSLANRNRSGTIAPICGISSCMLPPVVDPGTAVGSVTAEAAAQTELRPGTIVHDPLKPQDAFDQYVRKER